MTEEQQVVEEIKAEIAKLSAQDQAIVAAYCGMFRSVLAAGPQNQVRMAFALVGAELAAGA